MGTLRGRILQPDQRPLKGKVAYVQLDSIRENLLCQPCWKEITDAMDKCPRSNSPDTQANSVSARKTTQADNDAADSASFLTSYSGIALMSVGALAAVVLLVYFCCASSTEETQEDVDYG